MDEVAFKRINKRLDEIDNMILECIKLSKNVSQDIIEEHRELSSKHNEMASKFRRRLKEDFINNINREEK